MKRLVSMVMALCLTLCSAALAEAASDAGAAIEIADAAGLAAISEDLSGRYVLTADIDLSGVAWTPIGSFVPAAEAGEEAEYPDPAYAFTGSFDGGGHTISNLTVDLPEGMAVGLFGCAAYAEIGGFALDGASVDGAMCAGDAVGYAFCSAISDVTLLNGAVTAHAADFNAEGMFGGIVGAAMGSEITDCHAEATIDLPDGLANAGIVGGGLENTNVSGCTATGAIRAGSGVYGLGGVAGCGFASEYIADSTAVDVTITAGNGASLIGGIVGYAGGFEDPGVNLPVTEVTGCMARGVTVVTGEGPNAVGGIVGGGFYDAQTAAAYGVPFDTPTVFVIRDSAADATLNGAPVGLRGVQRLPD